MDILLGVTLGLALVGCTTAYRALRQLMRLEEKVRVLRYENLELAGRLDDIQAPRLRWTDPHEP